MTQRELKGFQRVVKAYQADLAGDILGRSQDGERIRRGPEPDIPNHKFAGVPLEPLAQPELADIQRLRLGHRPHHRMKRLAIHKGAHGADAVVETDQLIGGVGLHAGNFDSLRRRNQHKTSGTISSLRGTPPD